MKKTWKGIFAVFLAIVLTSVPLYNMVINGVYRWHVQQPEVVQGGTVVLFFGIMMFVCKIIFEMKQSIAILFFGVIYLSINGVLIPFLIDYIYFEILLFIGASINSIRKNEQELSGVISHNLLTGISIWGIGAVVCSLLQHGTISELRLYTLVLLVMCMYLSRKKIYKPMFSMFSEYIDRKDTNIINLLNIALCLIILILFAKTNTAQDYDSLWYGLRPEKVLVGEHSFYDYLGYGTFVYYYPKLMELLYLPISNMGDYSILQGANIFVLGFICVEVQKMFRTLYGKKNSHFEIMFNLLVISIPAVANISATAKPDILGMLLVIIAFNNAYIFFQEKKITSLVYCMVSLCLSTGTKLTYMLWGGIVFITVIFFSLLYRKKIGFRQLFAKLSLSNIIVICSSLGLIAGVHYRTYKLTGYPLYPILVEFFNKIGFKPRNYAFSVHEPASYSTNIAGYIKRIYQFFLEPNELGHVIMLWTSSVCFFLFIIFIIYLNDIIQNNDGKRIQGKFSVFLSVALGIPMIYYICTAHEPDGNYFILPMVVIMAVLLCAIMKTISSKQTKCKMGVIIFLCFFSVQCLMMFISHPSWSYGTQGFTKELVVNNFETKDRNKQLFEYNGYSKIMEYLEKYQNLSTIRFISSSFDSMTFRFPCAVEGANELTSSYLSGYVMQSYDAFKNYIEQENIKGLILGNYDNSAYREWVVKYLQEHTALMQIQDVSAVYYELK